MFAFGRPFPKCAIALILALASSSGTASDRPVEMGLMTCSFAASPTSPAKADPVSTIGGQRDIECLFRADPQTPDETYVGTLQFVGQATEALGNGVLMWVAKAPLSLESTVGRMQGKYAPQAGSQTGSQRPLVGESKASIVLYPLSHNDRPALAIGRAPGLIVGLELKLKAAPG